MRKIIRAIFRAKPLRDRDGRFVSQTHAKVIDRTKQMRRELGMPPSPALGE